MKKRVLSLFLAFTLCLTLLPTSAFAEGEGSSISDGVIGSSEVSGEGGGTLVPPDGSTGEGGGIYVPPGGPTEGGGGTYIPGEDTRAEIWRDTQLSHRISRPYDGTTDGSTVSITLQFTDGTNEIELSEGKDFTAVKTFDSEEAGDHTVSVEITLIGDAAAKYKLKEGEETFTIDGTIDPAAQKLTLSLSKSTCTVGKKLLPLLSISGVEEDAAVTYYYTQYKTIAGDSEYEGSEAIPKIDENTVIDKLDEEGNNTYYVYAKTAATKNYKAGISNVVELTVSESAAQAASVTKADGTDGGTYESLPAALNAAEDGDTVKLLENHTTDWNAVEAGEAQMAVVKKQLTLDLNVKTVDYLVVGEVVSDEEGGILESADGNLTVKGSSEGTGTNGKITTLKFVRGTLSVQDGGNIGSSDASTGLICEADSGTVTITGGTVYNAAVGAGASVTVSGGSMHAGFWSNDGTLTITGGTFGSVQFCNNSGTIAISGGTFSTLQNLDDNSSQIPPMSLLAPGYAFYDRYSEGAVKDGSKRDFLQNVTVKEHTHTMVDSKCACGLSCTHTNTEGASTIGEDGKCTVCGTQFAAVIGETYYTDVKSALGAAQDGDTVKLLADATLPGRTTDNTDLSKSLTLDLNGYVLGANGSLTVKSGTALTVTNAGAKKSEKPIQVGLYLNLLVEKGGSFTCTDGGLLYLGLLSAGTGDYSIKLVEGESHCTFISFSQGDESATVGDLLKVNHPGMALHAGNSGSDVQIARSTPIDQIDTAYKIFYVGACSEHKMDADGVCIYCGASYVASVTTSDGENTSYTALDDALDAVKDGDTVTLQGDAEVTKAHWLRTSFTLELNGKTATIQSGAPLFIAAQTVVQDSSAEKTGNMVCNASGTNLLDIQDGDLIIKSGTFAGKIAATAGGKSKLTIEGGTFTKEVSIGTQDSVSLSGGTFTQIWHPHSFLDLLADDYAFYDKDNKLVNAAKINRNLWNASVRTHQHSFTDGACGCGYTCPHTSVDESGVCAVCGKQFAASVTAGEDVTYYDTFDDALIYAFKNDDCTLKLLADVTGTTVMINNPFIFDLNGHNVDALSVDAKATIKDSGTTKGKIGSLTVSDTKVPSLTLGSLLEEGYGFKHENGIWADDSHKETISGLKVTVEEAPIKRVVLDAIGADKKKVPTTMAYGTTGAVTLEASCWTAGTDAPTYTWYKLEGAAATVPMEGVNGVKYTLPADLPAGKHTYLVTCTSGGYSKSAEITITVTPISLAGAEVTVKNPTYNGKKQSPTVTVKLDENTTLTKGTDFYVTAIMQTDAGSYKLTIGGTGNYTGEIKDVDWKIEPLKIDSVMVSSDISKTYDGMAEINMSAGEWAKVLTFKTLSAYDVVDVPSSAYTISDAYFVEKRGEETIHSPDAGEKYGITFKIALKSSNYVLQNYYDEEPATSKDITQSGGATFTIEQAKAPDMSKIRLEQYVFNDLAKTYEIELKTLLPELAKPCEYGEVTSGNYGVSWTNSDYYDTNDPATVINGVLRLPTKAANSAKGEIGTATVTIKTTNYQDFELTLYIIAQDKIILDSTGVTVSASDITYGQALKDSKITVSGTMICPRTKKEVKGTFAWTNPETKPDAAGDYTAEWTFTPAEGYEEYAPATGTIHIHVAPKSIEGATVTLKESSFVYDGTAKTPEVESVVLDGVTLECSGPDKDKDYYYGFSSGTDVGTYTFTVEGFNNYTGEVTVQWSITAREVTPTITVASCTYTGDALTPDVTLKDDLGNTIDPKEYEVSYSNNTGAGTATVTVTDKDGGNYVLSETSKNFEITKAIAPAATPGALTITNGLHETYSLELSTLLPKLDSPCDYGTITYDKKIVTDLGVGSFVTLVDGKTGKLTLEANRSSTDEGQFGTITVTISTGNYQDIPLTINVIAENQITPQTDGAVTAADITYGQALNDSVITGKMKAGANPVDGTFAWVDGTVKPDANDGYPAEWKFTPNDKKKYTEVTGTVTIKVNQATPTGEPKYTNITTSDKTLENAALTLDGSTLKPNAGKLEWVDDAGNVLPADTRVEANKTYKWRFTPTDTNYTTLTGEIALYHVSYYTIKAVAGAGGSISPTGNVSVREGRDQTFTITPDRGYTVSNVKIDGNSIGTVKSYTFENISKAHTIEVIFVKDNTPQTGVFVDVAAGSYYEDAVDWAAENGITKGTSDTTFSPDAACTRAQAVTFLWRAAGSPEPETRTMPFTDVSAGSYYYDAVLWAVENGIAKGTSHTTFSPDATCTRAQAVTFLWRSEKSPAGDTVNPFTDVKSTDYYADAVLWAVREEITKGTGNTTFSPNANCTRAQIVTLLWRCKK